MKKTGLNTTINNLSKKTRLTTQHVLPRHITKHPKTVSFLKTLLTYDIPKQELLYNLGRKLIGQTTNPTILKFLQEYSYPQHEFEELPEEFDLLGAVYQYLNTKYENLEQGSFYTNEELAETITNNLDFSKEQTIIDLACGSGIFLFTSNAQPHQIYGVDYDPIAVMISKFNYFLKFPDTNIDPQIYQADFLTWYADNTKQKYDYIVGNPPYGANLDMTKIKSNHITTGESFSYFIEYGSKLLKPEGKLSYLLPESILNVKRHVDIRDFILNETNLTHIKHYNNKFAGVMTDIYLLTLDINPKKRETITFEYKNQTHIIPKSVFKTFKNHVFVPSPKEDSAIIQKIKTKTPSTLSNSKFGLGVVTGNNKELLLENPSEQTEPILTGKEVTQFVTLSPKKYIVFDRTKLQQVAPEEMYRTKPRLIYKTISKKLVVAVDETGTLSTASANIIIPNTEGHNAYSVALLLNSNLYTFLNQKLHGATNKISRGNLEALPFPKFDEKELIAITELVKNYMVTLENRQALENFVYKYFELDSAEIAFIEQSIE